MRLSIRHSVSAALVLGAAALLLAACGGGDNDDNGRAGAMDGAGSGSGIVSVQSVDGTNVLADSEGRTLYTAEAERGAIRCTGACTSFWEPLGGSANGANSAATDLDLELGVVERPDGDRQLTFNGLPLYSFTEEEPGQLDGDGFVDDFEGTHFEWAAATTGADSGSAGSNEPSGSSGDSSPY